jgi:hypothetical protein
MNRVPRWLWPVCVMLVAACGTPENPDPLPAGLRGALDRGLADLETTRTEFGLDVAIATQIVGELTGDARAARIVTARRASFHADEMQQLGRLFDLAKPILPEASITGVTASWTVPDPNMSLGSGGGALINRCLADALECRLDEECRAFVGLDHQWGTVLTHQAVWVLFARWAGCSLEIDLEERRRTFGANLAKEMRADPVFTDLAAERLATLGHLGFGATIEPTWIAALLAAQQPDGCWRMGPGGPCHPHPTALALWALAVVHAGRPR